MKNKNVLIITPFFAPETHAAVFRAFKLVKYLKKYGWNPIVLTVDTNYFYMEDLKLLDEIPDVPIYRSRYIEPTIRGLRMALGGKDRTYAAMLKESNGTSATVSNNVNTSESPHKRSWMSRFYTYMLNRWIQVPDRFCTWENGAVKMGVDLVKKYDISIIYTTCLPFTTNRIGYRIKKKTGVHWVADFRDPLTYAKKLISDYLPVFVRQKKIEIDTFASADLIVGLSNAYMFIFDDQYQSKYSYKCHFIPTGLDDDYLPTTKVKKDNSIIFVGEYLLEYGDEFFKRFKSVLKTNPNLRLKIVGNLDINKRAAMHFVKNLQLEDNIDFIDHLSQVELYKQVRAAKAAVLIPGVRTHWWNNFAKLVDYIALEVPVLALVPSVSEARNELKKAGLGIFLDEYTDVQLAEILSKDDVLDQTAINHDYCKRYLASSQTKAFIKLFETLK